MGNRYYRDDQTNVDDVREARSMYGKDAKWIQTRHQIIWRKLCIYLPKNRDYWRVVLKRKRQGLSCLAEQLLDSHAWKYVTYLFLLAISYTKIHLTPVSVRPTLSSAEGRAMLLLLPPCHQRHVSGPPLSFRVCKVWKPSFPAFLLWRNI